MLQNKKSMGKTKYIVSVSGLPPKCTFSRFRRTLKNISSVKINYWIQDVNFIPSSQTSKVILETNSKNDADLIISLVSGQKVTENNKKYVFTALIESCQSLPSGSAHKDPGQSKDQMNNSSNEAINPLGNREQTKANQIPKFIQSKVIILNQMENLIEKHCQKQKPLFLRVCDGELRLRLSHLFHGKLLKDVYNIPASNVVDIYRKKYDESSDESFIIKIYKLIELACWPDFETMEGNVYLEEYDGMNDENNTDVVINTDDGNCDNNSDSSDVPHEKTKQATDCAEGASDVPHEKPELSTDCTEDASDVPHEKPELSTACTEDASDVPHEKPELSTDCTEDASDVPHEKPELSTDCTEDASDVPHEKPELSTDCTEDASDVSHEKRKLSSDCTEDSSDAPHKKPKLSTDCIEESEDVNTNNNTTEINEDLVEDMAETEGHEEENLNNDVDEVNELNEEGMECKE